jgi:transcriptional regulator with XRE-family HTH domain
VLVQPSLLPDGKPIVHEAGQVIRRDPFRVVKQLLRDMQDTDATADVTAEDVPRFDVRSVKSMNGCEQPIRLTGLQEALSGDGEFTTENVNAYASCKTRRATRCLPCSLIYQHDARHLISAGLKGGKGIEESVLERPALFLTLTAPSFGHVHVANGGKCLPRRDAETCEHGRRIVCWKTHESGDMYAGQPICPDCYDYESSILWNNAAGDLWRVTRINIERALVKALHRYVKGRWNTDVDPSKLRKNVSAQYVKVSEFQTRGMVHFHVALRLDGKRPNRPAPIGIKRLIVIVRRAVRDAEAETAQARQQRAVIGRKLESLREAAELTTDDLAALLEVKRQTVEGLERGTRTMRESHVEKFANVFGLDEVGELARLVDSYHRQKEDWRIGWGTQFDVQVLPAVSTEDEERHIERKPVTRRQTANYLAKYATKGSDVEGKLDRRFRKEEELTFLNVNNHLARMVRTSWRMARTFEHAQLDGWSHQLGYRGHFLTKSRKWSTTFKALRQVRIDHKEELRKQSWEALNPNSLVFTQWQFAGSGYRTSDDAWLAEQIRNTDRTDRAVA